jgi:phosphoribosylformimino-5-aminoimidazole carboxamide ribotide isomerase
MTDSGFQIIPAIDLMNGRCVRLQQGDAKRKTEYPVPPEEVARGYERDGAQRIHVVDLDGAFAGEPKNVETVRRICDATQCEVEVGGGIRTHEAACALLHAGADYIIIGTGALENPEFVTELVAEYGNRVIVGADARGGMLSTRGWTADTQVPVVPFLERLHSDAGVRQVIFTDIAQDGMFTGPNIPALLEVLQIPDIDVIASGGVGTLEDILALQALQRRNLRGVIAGKALYDGRVQLNEAVKAVAHHRGT